MDRLDQLAEAVMRIETRNSKVEAEKAWELSLTRRTIVFLGTYLVAVLVFAAIGSVRPFLDALIPTVAYILSVQSLPIIKRAWMKRYQSKRESL